MHSFILKFCIHSILVNILTLRAKDSSLTILERNSSSLRRFLSYPAGSQVLSLCYKAELGPGTGEGSALPYFLLILNVFVDL